MRSSVNSRPTNSSSPSSSASSTSEGTTTTLYKLAIVGSDQISILELNTVDGKLTPYNSLNFQNITINDTKWNHNNKVLISCSDDGSVVMGTPEGEIFGQLNLEEQVQSISIGESSRKLCSGGSSCIVKVWDLKRKEIINSFKGHKDIITSVTFSEGDQHVASGDASGTILIHNIVSNTLSNTLSNTQQSIKYLEYSPFYKTLLGSASDEGTVTVWDTISGKPHCVFSQQHQAPCVAVHFSKQNAALLASAGLDKNIYFYDIKEKRVVENIRVSQPISSFSYLDNGSIIAVGAPNGSVFIYDLKKSTTSPVSEITVDRGYIRTMSFQSKSKKSSLLKQQPQSEISKPRESPTIESLSSSTTTALKKPSTPPSSLSKQQQHAQERPDRIKQQQAPPSSSTTAFNIDRTHTTGMDVFSPVKTKGIVEIGSTHFPTVEDIKKQAQLEHFGSKINTKLSLENPFKPAATATTFKSLDLNSSQIMENSQTSNNRLSIYKALKPTHDDRSVFSPSGPTKKPKFNSPTVDDTNSENSTLPPPPSNYQTPLSLDENELLEAVVSFEDQKQRDDHMIDEESLIPSSIIASSSPAHLSKAKIQQLNVPPQPPQTPPRPSIRSNNVVANSSAISEERMKEVVQDVVQESIFNLQSTIHQDLTNIHVDVLRQFCLQQEQTFSLIAQLSKQVESLTDEVRSLREENKQLKNLF